jgi:hypothetical protein
VRRFPEWGCTLFQSKFLLGDDFHVQNVHIDGNCGRPTCLCRNYLFLTFPRWRCNFCGQSITIGTFGAKDHNLQFVNHFVYGICIAKRKRETAEDRRKRMCGG